MPKTKSADFCTGAQAVWRPVLRRENNFPMDRIWHDFTTKFEGLEWLKSGRRGTYRVARGVAFVIPCSSGTYEQKCLLPAWIVEEYEMIERKIELRSAAARSDSKTWSGAACTGLQCALARGRSHSVMQRASQKMVQNRAWARDRERGPGHIRTASISPRSFCTQPPALARRARQTTEARPVARNLPDRSLCIPVRALSGRAPLRVAANRGGSWDTIRSRTNSPFILSRF